MTTSYYGKTSPRIIASRSGSSGSAARRLSMKDLPVLLRSLLLDQDGSVNDVFGDTQGRYFLFSTNASLSIRDTNDFYDVYLYDDWGGLLNLVSASVDGAASNGPSIRPRMDGDARVIVFQSDADNLVAGDQNNASDIFMAYRDYWHLEAIGTDALVGSDASHPAADGQGIVVLYDRMGPDGLRRIHGYDTRFGNGEILSQQWNIHGFNVDSHTPGISLDGRYIAYLEHSVKEGQEVLDCTVKVRDLESGFLESSECPSALRVEEGYIPYFSPDARDILWLNEYDVSGRQAEMLSIGNPLPNE